MFSSNLRKTGIASLAKIILIKGLLLACLLSPHAAPASPPDHEAIYHNLQHTLLVRQALAQDRELAALHIGVKVEDRVAYLWGPVPSQALLQRAVRMVRGLPDIREVRSTLYLDAPDEIPLYLPPAVPMPGSPWHHQQWETKQTPSPSPGNGLGSAPLSPWHTPTGDIKPAVHEDVRYKPAMKDNTDALEEDPFVLPIIKVPAGPARSRAPDVTESALQRQIAELQSANRRYQSLHIRLDGARVHLSGTAQFGSDLHTLAHTIARLPGVENVVIGEVHVVDPRY